MTDMNARIRQAAGRGGPEPDEQTDETPEAATDFDSGPRQPPPLPPSINDDIRAAFRRVRAGGSFHITD